MEEIGVIEVVGSRTDLLGECPLWDDRVGVLYRIDIDGRCIHALDPATGSETTRHLAGRPGSIALTPDEECLLVASERSLWWLDWPSGAVTRWVDLGTGGPANRLNDGAADRAGRFWVGSMHEDATESTGVLHRVDGDGSSTMTREHIGVSNGLAFSPDGATMYFADTLADAVWRFPYDPATGGAGAPRLLTDFSDLPGRPDGACVDADGCYWIACVFGSAIARLTPAGAVDRVIDLPVGKPTKPAFGGPGLDVLFVTSIGGGGSHDRPEPPGENGRLLALDVGVTGVPEPLFARHR